MQQDYEWVGDTQVGRKGPRLTVRINGEAGVPPTAYYGGVRYGLEVDPFEIRLPFADVACMYHYDSIPKEWADIVREKDDTWVYVLLFERRGHRYAFELRKGGRFETQEAREAYQPMVKALHQAFEERDTKVLGDSDLVRAARSFLRKRKAVAVDRQLVLGELEALIDDRRETLFRLDEELRWSELPPWTEIRMAARPGQRLSLLFHVLEDRRRIYVAHQDFDWRSPCVEGQVCVAMGRHEGEALRLAAPTDGEGRARIDLGPLETPMCLKFSLGVTGRKLAGDVIEGLGEIMLRWGRPIEQRLDLHDWQPDNLGPGTPPEDFAAILRQDLLSAYNPDRDHFADVVLGQSLPPHPAMARVLRAAGLEGEAIERYLRKARQEVEARKAGMEGYDPFEAWAVGCLKGKGLDAFFREGGDRLLDPQLPSRVWTQDDAQALLQGIHILRDAPKAAHLRDLMRFAEAFVERIEREVEPTFYMQQLRRPTKRFMANGDVARPHAWAVLALLGLRGAFHGESALQLRGRSFAVDLRTLDDLIADQADHVIREHDLEQDGPDFLALFDRKRHVTYQPFIDCVQAFKLLHRERPERRWRNFLAELRGEIWKKFQRHYRVTGIQQRVELLHTTLPGVLPFFPGDRSSSQGRQQEGPGSR